MAGKFSQTIGSRAQVWHGTAKHTSGGLEKKDLFQNHAGRIVSKSKHFSAKKEMRLVKHGYTAKKGKFGCVKAASRKRGSRKRGSRKRGPGRPRKIKGGDALHPARATSSYMLAK